MSGAFLSAQETTRKHSKGRKEIGCVSCGPEPIPRQRFYRGRLSGDWGPAGCS